MISYLTPFTGLLPARPGAPVVTVIVLVAAIILILLMALRELAAQATGAWQTFARDLTIAIYPLLVTFVITLVIIGIDFARHPPPLH